ncbi:MAG: hypothetical protein WCA08_00265 [Desulfoferrobacter sp.]
MRYNRQLWFNTFIPFFFLSVGLFLTFYPTLLSGFSYLQTDPGDSRSINFRLEHIFLWLTNNPGHTSLWDPPIFYPLKGVLAYSDTLLTLAPIYWIWRFLGCAPEVSFSLWMMTLCVMNYALALLLLHRGLGVGPLAASLGAYLIAFGNCRIAQLGHQQLLSHAFVLAAIYALMQIFRPILPAGHVQELPVKRRRVWICAFFLFFAAQFYAGYYTGYFLFLVVLIAAIWSICIRRFRARFLEVVRVYWPTIVCSFLLAVALLLPLAYRYLRVAEDLGFVQCKLDGVPRVTSYLWMGWDNLLYGWTGDLTLFNRPLFAYLGPEHQWGLGLLTTTVLLWFFWQYRGQPGVQLIFLIIVTAIVAFTYFPGGIYLWPIWYHTLPGIQGIRVMARMNMLLLIPAGMAVSMLVHRYRKDRTKLILVVAVALFCCLEQVRKPLFYNHELYQRRVNTIVQNLNEDCEAFFLSELYPKQPVWMSQLDSAWASLLSGIPSITGYSGKFPFNDAIRTPVIREPVDYEKMDKEIDEWCAKTGLDRDKICWLRLKLPNE